MIPTKEVKLLSTSTLSLLLTRRWFLVIFRKKKLFVLLFLVLPTLLFIRKQCDYNKYMQSRSHFEQTDRTNISNSHVLLSEAEGIHEHEVSIGTEEDRVVVGSVSKSPLPKVVWLMSYPNSGTSFTMHLVSKGGNRSVATNYGMEDKVSATNIPLYPSSPNGPYIIHSHKSLPTEYILTKTHCGGRCVDCSPQGYIENQTSFLKRCAQGFRKNESFEDKEDITWYNPHLAQKAIHIVRNPFDNLVSNFHLEWKKKMKRMKSDTNSIMMYSNATKAFRDWCSDIDLKYIHKEKEMLPMNVVEFFEVENIPCHAHFYRYAKVRNTNE